MSGCIGPCHSGVGSIGLIGCPSQPVYAWPHGPGDGGDGGIPGSVGGLGFGTPGPVVGGVGGAPGPVVLFVCRSKYAGVVVGPIKTGLSQLPPPSPPFGGPEYGEATGAKLGGCACPGRGWFWGNPTLTAFWRIGGFELIDRPAIPGPLASACGGFVRGLVPPHLVPRLPPRLLRPNIFP